MSAFQEAIYPFTRRTGTGMAFEGTRDLKSVLESRIQSGNPPDLVVLPDPMMLRSLVEQGRLIPLDSFIDMEKLQQDYGQTWIDLASYEGHLYGLVYDVTVKSLVWYNPKAFQSQGYQVPTSWDELIALSDRIVDDGSTPWCLGIESGAASGWLGTDWIEDILLRTAGFQVYDDWLNHRISWIDPSIQEAWEIFGQIARRESYVYGGTAGVLSTSVGDAPAPMFDNPPGCYMHRQAPFVTAFFPSRARFDEDYDFFVLPGIDPRYGAPLLGSATMIVALNDRPEVQSMVKYLARPDPQEILAAQGGFVSASRAVSMSAYPDEVTRRIAGEVANASLFTFDASDLMPSAVGSGSFWKGVRDYIRSGELEEILQDIEESAQGAYRP